MHLLYMLIICTMCVPDRSVWVSDSQKPFVEHPGMSPEVLYMKEKQSLVIPCRATHPNVTSTLVKVSGGNMNEMTKGCVLIIKCIYTLHIALCPSLPNHAAHILILACPTFFRRGNTMLFLPLQIIRHIVLILATITLWRVCPFVCVRLRICVKVCADMFVSVGARVLSEGASGQCY